jgi:hypothetical protein
MEGQLSPQPAVQTNQMDNTKQIWKENTVHPEPSIFEGNSEQIDTFPGVESAPVASEK